MTLKKFHYLIFCQKFLHKLYSNKFMKKNILFVVAHRDDETFGCGGTIAKFSEHHFGIFQLTGIVINFIIS